MNLTQKFMTENRCYKAGRKITPKGIMLHSTATPGIMASQWFSRWNNENVSACVHAFLDDNEVWQYLPWNHRGWHAGGSANNTHISFEICEPKDWTTNKEYFEKAYTNAIELCVYLCKMYKLEAKDIISHKEGHQKGIASNHGDPDHWWKYFNKTMDDFRADVNRALNPVSATNKEVRTVQIEFEVLKKGAKGEFVELMQTLLDSKGYCGKNGRRLKIDGDLGTNSLFALGNFQADMGLDVDYSCGKLTWTSLLK